MPPVCLIFLMKIIYDNAERRYSCILHVLLLRRKNINEKLLTAYTSPAEYVNAYILYTVP
jgi:hypothetical protein